MFVCVCDGLCVCDGVCVCVCVCVCDGVGVSVDRGNSWRALAPPSSCIYSGPSALCPLGFSGAFLLRGVEPHGHVSSLFLFAHSISQSRLAISGSVSSATPKLFNAVLINVPMQTKAFPVCHPRRSEFIKCSIHPSLSRPKVFPHDIV